MNSYLISIVVPIYNVETYVKKCIESIVNQTYENIEIILINDGSTDSSLQVCELFNYDKRVNIIDKKNEGLSRTRQVGINLAKGYYLCTIDSDDYIEEDYVEKMYKKIHAEKADICVCATRHISADGSIATWGFDRASNPTYRIVKDDIYLRYYNLSREYYMSDSWNKMYRTEFIKNSTVKFSLNRKYNGTDLLFNHKLLLHLPVVTTINETLYNHRKLEDSRTGRKNKQLQEGFMLIMNDIINEAKKLKYKNELNSQLNNIYVNFLRYTAFDIFNEEENSKETKKSLHKLIENSKQYLRNNAKLELRVRDMNEIELKAFCFILKYCRASTMLNYLKLRPLLINFRNSFKRKN